MTTPSNGIIDVHNHYPATAQAKAIGRQTGGKNDGIAIPKWDLQKSLDMMDAVGTELAVLSPPTPVPQFKDVDDARRVAHEINEETAKLISDYPQRYSAVAFLPLPYIDVCLDELAYAMDELNFEGAHMFTNYGGKYAGHADFQRLLEEIDRRGIVTMTHPTSPFGLPKDVLIGLPPPTLEFIFDTTRMAADLLYSGSLARFPNIKWILAHGGGTVLQSLDRMCRSIHIMHEETNLEFGGIPDTDDQGRTLMKQFYVDVTWNEHDPALGALVDTFGADKLMFGSDMPFTHFVDVIKRDVQTLHDNPQVDDAVKSKILRENALRLFPSIADKLKHREPA